MSKHPRHILLVCTVYFNLRLPWPFIVVFTIISSHSAVSNDLGPAVAEFSDEEDNDSLSEGEMESRDRLAVERKVRVVRIRTATQKLFM